MSQLDLIPITAEDIEKTGGYPRSCVDCKHSWHPVEGRTIGRYCMHPNLLDIIEADADHQNSMMACDPVRDLKVGCGHAARWFEPKAG